jgi:hypothetical protein
MDLAMYPINRVTCHQKEKRKIETCPTLRRRSEDTRRAEGTTEYVRYGKDRSQRDLG